MAEDDLWNIAVVELAVALTAEQAIGEAPSRRDRDRSEAAVLGDIADRIEMLEVGALIGIDQHLAVAVERDTELLDAEVVGERGAPDRPNERIDRPDHATVLYREVQQTGRVACEGFRNRIH